MMNARGLDRTLPDWITGPRGTRVEKGLAKSQRDFKLDTLVDYGKVIWSEAEKHSCICPYQICSLYVDTEEMITSIGTRMRGEGVL